MTEPFLFYHLIKGKRLSRFCDTDSSLRPPFSPCIRTVAPAAHGVCGMAVAGVSFTTRCRSWTPPPTGGGRKLPLVVPGSVCGGHAALPSPTAAPTLGNPFGLVVCHQWEYHETELFSPIHGGRGAVRTAERDKWWCCRLSPRWLFRLRGNTSERRLWRMQRGCVGAAVGDWQCALAHQPEPGTASGRHVRCAW